MKRGDAKQRVGAWGELEQEAATSFTLLASEQSKTC
jgi:hypothetical protein